MQAHPARPKVRLSPVLVKISGNLITALKAIICIVLVVDLEDERQSLSFPGRRPDLQLHRASLCEPQPDIKRAMVPFAQP